MRAIMAVIWKFNNVVISKTRDFARPPVVVASFPDMAVLEYEPFTGVTVQEVFCVYSSGSAIIELHMANTGTVPLSLMVYPLVHLPHDSLRVMRYDGGSGGVLFSHS